MHGQQASNYIVTHDVCANGDVNMTSQSAFNMAAGVAVTETNDIHQRERSGQSGMSRTSVPITAVPLVVLQQNGGSECELDSPGDTNQAGSGEGSQVVVNGTEGNGVNPDRDTPSNQPSSIVDSTHYITVTEGNGTRSYTSLTPVNPTVVSDTDTVGPDAVSQGVHQTYVQYVEGSADQTIFTATNGQMAYPVYTVGETGTMYTPASGQYYNTNSTAVTYSQVASNLSQGGTSGQILTQGGSTYLIQQGVDPETAHSLITAQRSSPQTVAADAGVTYLVPGNTNTTSLEADGQGNQSHNTRVSPATVHWLLENYETAEGVSLPRSTLYYHYLRHCNERKQEPVNAASFGKLIRSVFLGLRTRRLGTRGNSKYHYYGIRVKPGSILNQLSEDGTSIATRPQTGSQKRYKFVPGSSQKNADSQYDQTVTNSSSQHSSPNTLNHQPQHTHQEYLGDSATAIPDFPDIEVSNISPPEDCTLEDVDTFRSIYREHCEAFLDAILNLEFPTVESLWREFWRSQDNNNGDECEEEKYLSKTKLFLLCKFGPVQQFVRKVDYLFYQNLVDVLIPDVLRPIPSSLTQGIRNFAKSLEAWLTSAMTGCPPEIFQIKLAAVSAFAQTLRRYTSLNHLAQAARAVLQNSTQINQMLVDLNRVDFHNVQEQASWVCQCDDVVVQRLEADFKATLQQQNSLEQWASWLKGVVTQILKPYEGKPNFTKAARQFLLKWSFYSSMVIRDLTLRSAASFGSFHLIRLLYDEYMFFLIEHQVAIETGETPIAVMGEKLQNPSSMTSYNVNGLPLGVGNTLVTKLVGTSNEVIQHPASKRHKMS